MATLDARRTCAFRAGRRPNQARPGHAAHGGAGPGGVGRGKRWDSCVIRTAKFTQAAIVVRPRLAQSRRKDLIALDFPVRPSLAPKLHIKMY